ANGMQVTVGGVQGNPAANGTFFIQVLSGTTFGLFTNASLTTAVNGTGAYTAGGYWTIKRQTSGTVTNPSSPASPNPTAIHNCPPATGLISGESVLITGVTSNTNANGIFFVKVLTTTTFALYSDSALTTAVTGSGISGSTGTWTTNFQ